MMSQIKLHIIVGTRPNFIKITRFKKVAASIGGIEVKIIHTGQHFDDVMSKVFFEQFAMLPDHIIELSSTTPVAQIAEIMARLETSFTQDRPDAVMVVGDVNSTLAGAIVANKLNIPLFHLESGLRSFDRTMPEEINRILTDQLADGFFVTEQSGVDNLINEQKKPEQIHFVGNTMIDTMVAFSNEIDQCNILEKMQVKQGEFILMTMHRPSTVDNPVGLKQLVELLKTISARAKIVFPIHPRTRKRLSAFGLSDEVAGIPGLILSEPLDYFAFQKLISACMLILTDSGGIQEESTWRRLPCLTLRPNTERPVTVETGSNTLMPFDNSLIMKYIESIRNGQYKKGQLPPLWDGHATERILQLIKKLFKKQSATVPVENANGLA